MLLQQLNQQGEMKMRVYEMDKKQAGMMTQELLRKKIQGFRDETILDFIKAHKKYIHDWRNWGRNIDRMIAEEAHRRGMID